MKKLIIKSNGFTPDVYINIDQEKISIVGKCLKQDGPDDLIALLLSATINRTFRIWKFPTLEFELSEFDEESLRSLSLMLSLLETNKKAKIIWYCKKGDTLSEFNAKVLENITGLCISIIEN